VRNGEVLFTVKEQRNTLHEISNQKANWIGHILRGNCLLRQITEGNIKGGKEMTGRRWRSRRKLLDDPKERRGYSSKEGSSRSLNVESSLWKRLWICRETENCKWINFFFEYGTVNVIMWKKYCRAVPDTDDIMVHKHCTLDTQGYKPTLGICDIAFPLQHLLHYASHCCIIRKLSVLLSCWRLSLSVQFWSSRLYY
jgi:hypothetical protein